jgi:protein O-GlcNAc transferase
LDLEPNLAETHDQLGNILQQMGEFSKAIACFQNALKLQPNFIDALHNWALLNRGMKFPN